jgi:hypothetical protein
MEKANVIFFSNEYEIMMYMLNHVLLHLLDQMPNDQMLYFMHGVWYALLLVV